MAHSPPRRLIELLERLELATADDVRRVVRRVGRLAGELPRFESVWIDALVAARHLTPHQAAEINAGRANSLIAGPYRLCAPVAGPAYGTSFRARRADSGEAARLIVIDMPGSKATVDIRVSCPRLRGHVDRDFLHGHASMAMAPNPDITLEQSTTIIQSQLDALVAAADRVRGKHTSPIVEAGVEADRIWAASPWHEGRTMAEWLVRNGRVPAASVIGIARTMVGELASLEAAGICHGDVSTATLLWTTSGNLMLTEPGLRAIVRPEEGFAHADLPPEAYDCLAPERIVEGTPPSTAADIYACGCLWWHMLCGRPPLAGGDALGKLRAAQAAKIIDVRRLAPEIPGPLGEVISACLQPDPRRRPDSMARLAAMLGPPSPAARPVVSHALVEPTGGGTFARRMRAAWSAFRPFARPRRSSRRKRSPWAAVAMVGCLGMVALLWPLLQRGGELESPPAGAPTAKELAHGKAVSDEAENVNSSVSVGDNRPAESIEDPAVIPAQYEQPAFPVLSTAPGPDDLVLDADGPLRIDSLRLEAGQCVRGELGQRPRVTVPFAGLPVEAEEVCFEGIDFVWDYPSPSDSPNTTRGALIELRSGSVEFRRCTLRSRAASPDSPAAIRWIYPVDPAEAALSLPSGRVRLTDCVLENVAVGIDCRTAGALTVEIGNTLILGGGPMLRLDHCPKADEPFSLTMERVTLRDTGPLLECHCETSDGEPGQWKIEANACVFAPGSGDALILLTGSAPPERVVPKIQWTGQGSLVSPEADILAWRSNEDMQYHADETAVSIDGLVRGEVGFAGATTDGLAGSRVIRWQAPLRSAGPPGVGVIPLD